MKLQKTHTTKILAMTELKQSKKFLTMSEKAIFIYDHKFQQIDIQNFESVE